MLKKSTFWLLLLAVCALPFCTTSKKSVTDGKNSAMPMYSYSKDIAPAMQTHCAPCHFPNGGKQRFLDTHNAMAANIDEVLHRVTLPRDSMGFMPFKMKKPPMSDSLITVLRTWKAEGMPE